MSLFDLQDVCIVIGSLATLDLPMVVDLIGIYGLKGPYCKWVYLVTLAMSLFDLQDVCIVIGSLATLDLPMVVDLIGIYGLKGPYCTLTTTNWFFQALSVIPRGSWGDVARRFTMIRWAIDRSDLIIDHNYDETMVIQMNRMFIRWTGPAPGPMGRFKPITPIHSLEPRVAQHLHHNLKTLASTQNSAAPLPQPHARPPPTAAPRLAAIRSSCDRTCFDHCDEVTPSVEKSISLIVQADRRNRDSGRGPDWRIYRRLQFEVPVSS
ncbi:hypothetical protein F511_38729 [Dorcoceras hygrometricum]|uniref:Uncharacterized protein n=1 Tax=Dorcoceras hygrometricum TaxID=472368 RepID=A0A2Z7BSW8_9LAMI|nr:hypothetical protein F511_38729 [Dorcoceras hygrometricum]